VEAADRLWGDASHDDDEVERTDDRWCDEGVGEPCLARQYTVWSRRMAESYAPADDCVTDRRSHRYQGAVCPAPQLNSPDDGPCAACPRREDPVAARCRVFECHRRDWDGSSILVPCLGDRRLAVSPAQWGRLTAQVGPLGDSA